jgi:hypothetical protein
MNRGKKQRRSHPVFPGKGDKDWCKCIMCWPPTIILLVLSSSYCKPQPLTGLDGRLDYRHHSPNKRSLFATLSIGGVAGCNAQYIALHTVLLMKYLREPCMEFMSHNGIPLIHYSCTIARRVLGKPGASSQGRNFPKPRRTCSHLHSPCKLMKKTL